MTTLLVLLLIGATGIWQYQSLSRSYVTLMQQQQQALAELAANDLKYKLDSHLNALVREARAADAETFSTPSATQAFFLQNGLRPMFNSISVVGPEGTVIATDPAASNTVNVSDRAYFRTAFDEGVPAISEPLRSRGKEVPVIAMAAPVKDERGDVAGVLVASMELYQSNVLGELARARAGNEGYYLIETTGSHPVYVVHPDLARVLAPVASSDQRASGDLTSSAVVGTTGWTLRVVLPAQAAYAPLAKARQALVVQMVVLGFLCSALVWAATVWLMQPLATLHKAIKTLRRAPDSAVVALDVRAQDERGDLAREFDALMAELRDKRIEMAVVTDASPIGLFRCDTDGQMAYVNDEYLRIHGLTRADAARGWLSLVPEQARPKVWDDWLRLVRLDQPFQVTRQLRRLDGREVQISQLMRPIRADGVVIGQVGTIADITERTQAQQALRILTTILEATTDYVAQLDKSGRLTYMNPAARLCAGIALDVPVDHLTMADFNSPAMIARLRDEIVPAAAAHGVWVGESEAWNAERHAFPVSHMVIAHRDSSGSIERFSSIMRDISAAKAAERSLLENEARLRTMADALPMQVGYVDASERYRFVNLAFERMHGLARASVPDQSVEQVLGTALHREVEPHIRAALTGERVTFEREATTAAGYVCHETSYIPQRDVDGKDVVGIHEVTTDITRRKLEERRLALLASQDPLTGLGNRAAFELRLSDAMRRARSQQAAMALMYLDLDRFKQVNDSWGHQVGDALLQAVAGRLSQTTRSTDFVARLGGDEFTVILEALRSPDDASQVADKVLAAMSDAFQLDGRTLGIGVSVGVAYQTGGACTGEQLVRLADEMLYQAKGAGRNNFKIAEFAQPVPTGDLA